MVRLSDLIKRRKENPSPPPTPPPPLTVRFDKDEGFQVAQFYTSVNSELVGLTTRALKSEDLGLGAEGKIDAGIKGVSVGGKGEYVTSRSWVIDARFNPKFIDPNGQLNAQAFSRITEASARAGTAIPEISQFKSWGEGKQSLENTGSTLDVDKGNISISGPHGKFVVATVKPPETSHNDT